MTKPLRIGLIGDYNPSIPAHVAIPQALSIAGKQLGRVPHFVWVPTDELSGNVEKRLMEYSGLWCVPGSPYANMAGALSAIRFARDRQVPFLGTCGGFQHAVLEFARNVLGHSDAMHGETNPDAELQIITPLSCSLAGASAEVYLQPGTSIAKIYGGLRTVEMFNCNYGVNPTFAQWFAGSALRVSGVDAAGAPRVVELDSSPFFIGTLYQPERSALTGKRHPLIEAFLESAS